MKLKTYKAAVFYICFFIYLAGFLFDVTVSATMYSNKPEYFRAFEANEEIVAAIESNALPVKNLLQLFIMLNVPAYLYYVSSRYSSNAATILSILATISLAVLGTMHLTGGLSWW